MTRMSRSPRKALGGETCQWCGRKLLPTGTLNGDGQSHPLAGTRDHLIPRSAGGPNHFSNLVLACYECNHKRGVLPLVEWIKIVSTTNHEEKDGSG